MVDDLGTRFRECRTMSDLRGLIEAGRKWFCRHDWKYSRFQALSDDGLHDVTCTKCGKYDRAILRALEADANP